MLPSGRLDILNRLHTSSMKPNMPVGEYISQLLSTRIRQELDGTPTENTAIAHIIRTLPESCGILKNQLANEQTPRNVITTLKAKRTPKSQSTYGSFRSDPAPIEQTTQLRHAASLTPMTV